MSQQGLEKKSVDFQPPALPRCLLVEGEIMAIFRLPKPYSG